MSKKGNLLSLFATYLSTGTKLMQLHILDSFTKSLVNRV